MLLVRLLFWLVFMSVDFSLLYCLYASIGETKEWEAKQDEIRFWTQHFKENVAASWIFDDGVGY